MQRAGSRPLRRLPGPALPAITDAAAPPATQRLGVYLSAIPPRRPPSRPSLPRRLALCATCRPGVCLPPGSSAPILLRFPRPSPSPHPSQPSEQANTYLSTTRVSFPSALPRGSLPPDSRNRATRHSLTRHPAHGIRPHRASLALRATSRPGVHLHRPIRGHQEPPTALSSLGGNIPTNPATYRLGIYLHATLRTQIARFSPTARHSEPPHPVAEPRLHPPRRATPSEN